MTYIVEGDLRGEVSSTSRADGSQASQRIRHRRVSQLRPEDQANARTHGVPNVLLAEIRTRRVEKYGSC